jgi:hypothetical protein
MLLALAASLVLAQGIPLKSGAGADLATVDSTYKGLRTSLWPTTANCYSLSSSTGIVAAALAANATVFAMRTSPAAGKSAVITKVMLRYVTQVAYTVPISATRRLALFRGSGAQTSGGTTLSTAIPPKDSASAANSAVQTSEGGFASISTTAALTVTGITYEAQEFSTMHLGAVGAAGATSDWTVVSDSALGDHPIELAPGQLLAIRNPVVFDAAGTWVLAVSVDWCER